MESGRTEFAGATGTKKVAGTGAVAETVTESESVTVTVTEAETESETVTVTVTVAEAETVTGFPWTRRSSRTPDTGPRTPDTGLRKSHPLGDSRASLQSVSGPPGRWLPKTLGLSPCPGLIGSRPRAAYAASPDGEP